MNTSKICFIFLHACKVSPLVNNDRLITESLGFEKEIFTDIVTLALFTSARLQQEPSSEATAKLQYYWLLIHSGQDTISFHYSTIFFCFRRAASDQSPS